MVYDVVGLIDKKYIVDPLDTENSLNYGYDFTDSDDYDEQEYDVVGLSEVYNSTYITPKKRKTSDNIIEVVKVKLVNCLAREIVKTDLICVLGDNEDEIVESLSNYSLEDLFYMRKGLKEYETMANVTEEDYFDLFNVDTRGQLNFL